MDKMIDGQTGDVLREYKTVVVEGRKDEKGKIDWSCMPFDSLEQVAIVFQKGATPEEYGKKRSWLPGIMFSRMFASIWRHLFRWFWKGQDVDDKSGCHHLAHVAANSLMLLTYIEKEQFDDRPNKKEDS